MQIDEIRRIFDTLIQMPPGHTITVKAADGREANSIRTRFYRERQIYSQRIGKEAEGIVISKIYENDQYVLKVRKESEPRITIQDPDGSERPFIMERRRNSDLSPTEERRRRLMEQDGLDPSDDAEIWIEPEDPIKSDI